MRSTCYVMLCIGLFMLNACATIKVTPFVPGGVESSSQEVGKTYTLQNYEDTVVSMKGSYVTIIKANRTCSPDIDSIFKSNYPPIREGARFQIVGLTEEGNYVGWPLDGYRPKTIKPSGKSNLLGTLLTTAVQVAGARALGSAAISNPEGLSTAGRVAATVAAVNTVAGAADNGTDAGPAEPAPAMRGLQSAAKATNGGAALSSDAIAVDHRLIVSDLNKSYSTEDAIVFFEKGSLKAYAVRPFVERDVMDTDYDHIFDKIMDTEGNFSLARSFIDVKKRVIQYKGVANKTASFRYEKFIGSVLYPAWSEEVDVDLSKTSTAEIDGYKFDVLSADQDKADIKVRALQM